MSEETTARKVEEVGTGLIAEKSAKIIATSEKKQNSNAMTTSGDTFRH